MSIKKEIMRDICNSESLIQAFNSFLNNKELLKDCKFIFSVDGKANMPGFILQHTFKDNNPTGIYSIFNNSKILLLDDYVVSEMLENGTITYGIDYSISLDSMVVTYIYRLLKEQSFPEIFEQIFMFLTQKEVNFDPMPYLLENVHKIHNPKHLDDVFETLKAYEIFKTIDIEHFEKNRVVRSIYPAEYICNQATMSLEDMKRLSTDPLLKSTFQMQRIKYCLLLKMTLIQFSNPSKTSDYKLNEFIEFCDSVFKSMFLREILIAKEYFDKGQKLKFFRKVQKKQRDLLDNLKNMSWDLYHIWKLEDNITMTPEGGARYYISPILTFDMGFIEIIKLFPLRAIGFTQDGKEVMPTYDVTNFNKSIDSKYGINKYFEDSEIARRELSRNINLNIDSIIATLEKSICTYL